MDLTTGLVGVALGCAGTAAGTAANNYYQALRDRRNKQLELGREKIEEAYQLLVQIDTLFNRVYASRNLSSGMQEHIFSKSEKVFREFLQRESADPVHGVQEKVQELYARLKMLAALYIPVLDDFLVVSSDHYTAWLMASGDEYSFWLDLFPTRPRELTEDELDELEHLRDILIEEGFRFSSVCKEMKQCLSDLMSDVSTRFPLKHKKRSRKKIKAVPM